MAIEIMRAFILKVCIFQIPQSSPKAGQRTAVPQKLMQNSQDSYIPFSRSLHIQLTACIQNQWASLCIAADFSTLNETAATWMQWVKNAD